MKKCFFALILCFQISFSQNANHLDTVLKQLKIKKSEINLELFTQKTLPYDKEKSVLVIAKYASEVTPDYFIADAYIVMIDNLTGQIIYKFIEPHAWTSDAIMLNSISIDTGLYILNKNTRAFGVRVNYTGSSQANPYSKSNLSLYIVNENSLKPILLNYIISHSHGDWDTTCAGEFEDNISTIDIDKQQTNNFNNIIIKTKTVKTKNIPTNDDCIAKESIKKRTSKLTFNGKEYK